MKPYAIAILIIAGAFLALIPFYARIVIQSDGLTYYAITRSLVEDGNFDMTNQINEIPGDLRINMSPRTGKLAPGYSCGFAVLYAPFLFVSNLLPFISDLHPYAQNYIIPFADSFGIFLGSVIFGFLTVWIGSATLTMHYKIPAATATAFALLFFAGTSLMFYTFTVPSFAHAADAFLVALSILILFWQTPRPFLREALLGFTLALSTCLRNHNALMILPAIGALLYLQRKEGGRKMLLSIFAVFLGALPIMILQFYYNWFQFGSIFRTATGVRINAETIGERLHSGAHFYAILIHPVGGVYVWAPLAFLGTIGLIAGAFRRSRLAAVSLIMVAVVVISLRFFGMIWAGGSFAQRFLTHLYIFWLIGFAELWMLRRKTALITGAFCLAWTFFLFNLYYVMSSSAEGRQLLNRDQSRYTPREMITTAAGIYRDSGKNAVALWYESLSSPPYPSVLFLKSTPHKRR